MNNTQLIHRIRQDEHLSAKFDQLSLAGRRRLLEIADGDDWHIEDNIDYVIEVDGLVYRSPLDIADDLSAIFRTRLAF